MRIVAALSNEANSGRTLEVGSWAERALPVAERSTPERRALVLERRRVERTPRRRPRARSVTAGKPFSGRRLWASSTQSRSVQLAYVAAIDDDYDQVMATLGDGLDAADAHPDRDDAAVTGRSSSPPSPA